MIPLLERAPRIPLYVPVATQPALENCWSVNISQSGIGLVASGGSELAEGANVTCTLKLPGVAPELQLRGYVAWRFRRGGAAVAEQELAIGVRLSWIDPNVRVAFERYLLEHRFGVVVAFATAQEQRRVSAALDGEVDLYMVDNQEELHALGERGDISAMLVFGRDGEGNTRRLARLTEHLRATLGSSRVLPADASPQVLYCGQGSAEALLRLLSAGHVQRVLSHEISTNDLNAAVLHACNEHGARSEQRRVAQALERALARRPAPGAQSRATAQPAAGTVFHSRAMRGVLDQVRLAAPHKVSVLLQGETGTGKEVLAQLLHQLSPRCDASFVVQDCGVLTETLLESELFGHVKGAFTGATRAHPGLFVLADQGTVFLDEIENTSPSLQARLLRVIETGTLRAVGDARSQSVDLRIVAASNRDLAAEVEAGRFRADLYYRLSTFPIAIPPLRQRREDVLPLAEQFLVEAVARLGTAMPSVTPAAREALQRHDWPGNLRELRNIIERAVLLCGPGGAIDEEHLKLGRAPLGGAHLSAQGSLRARVDAYERQIIAAALAQHAGTLRRAARALAMSPATLRRKALAHGLLAAPGAGDR